jgi:hypothetical protein
LRIAAGNVPQELGEAKATPLGARCPDHAEEIVLVGVEVLGRRLRVVADLDHFVDIVAVHVRLGNRRVAIAVRRPEQVPLLRELPAGLAVVEQERLLVPGPVGCAGFVRPPCP